VTDPSTGKSQCGDQKKKSNSTLKPFFGLSNSTHTFFGPKESQSPKPFFARFLTVFFFFYPFFFFFLMVSRNPNGFAKLQGRGVMFRETIKITKKHRKWFRETHKNTRQLKKKWFRWRGQLKIRPHIDSSHTDVSWNFTEAMLLSIVYY
jgi:hypothetical protein